MEELKASIYNLANVLTKIDNVNINIELSQAHENIASFDFMDAGEFLKSIGDMLIQESIKGNLDI